MITLRVPHIGSIIGLFYASWAVGQFFDKEKKVNYLKGLKSYFLGMISFPFFAVILGVIIEIIIKIKKQLTIARCQALPAHKNSNGTSIAASTTVSHKM
ncbi:hypothetical protein E1171_06495 [Cytophagales bacterium RKSG123]|nr:hypothetical protein [Xanthovirga aplysinae]